MKAHRDRRVVGVLPGSAIVVGNMIGTGIFTTTGLMVAMGAGAGDIILGWILGGVLALCGALCYGELGANMPESGGEYYFLSRLLHPSMAFLSGWVSLIVGFSAPIAAAAIAMHLYLAQVIPGWPIRTMAVSTIIILSVLHAYDLRLGGQVQTGLTFVKILLLLSFILGIYIAAPNFTRLTEFTPAFWLEPSFAVLLIFVSFAYSGWNAAAYIGAEITNPARNLPRSLILGTFTVMVLYLLINAAFLSIIPPHQLSGVEEVAQVAGSIMWGKVGGNLVSVFIAASLVSTVSAMIIIGPRVIEAMAADRLFPSGLARLNRKGVPSRAVALQALIAMLFAVTATFGPLLVYIGYTLNIFAALTVFALFRLRQKGNDLFMICRGYPITPAIFVIFAIWMTIWSIQSQPLSTLMGLATLAIGYGVYQIRNQWLKG